MNFLTAPLGSLSLLAVIYMYYILANLSRRYGEVIPVLLRDGRAVAKIRLGGDRLERIVRRRR